MSDNTADLIWPGDKVEIDPNAYSSVVEMFEVAFR